MKPRLLISSCEILGAFFSCSYLLSFFFISSRSVLLRKHWPYFSFSLLSPVFQRFSYLPLAHHSQAFNPFFIRLVWPGNRRCYFGRFSDWMKTRICLSASRPSIPPWSILNLHMDRKGGKGWPPLVILANFIVETSPNELECIAASKNGLADFTSFAVLPSPVTSLHSSSLFQDLLRRRFGIYRSLEVSLDADPF